MRECLRPILWQQGYSQKHGLPEQVHAQQMPEIKLDHLASGRSGQAPDFDVRARRQIPVFVPLLLGALSSVAATLVGPAPAHAEIQYPWCAVYGGGMDGFSTTVCSFDTIEQCLATVRGLGGMCQPNWNYSGTPPRTDGGRVRRVR